MRKNWKKGTAMALVAVTAVPMLLAGCGSKGGSEDATSFTWLLDAGEQTQFYDEYEENPIYKYWSAMEWDADKDGKGTTISVDFITPPAGSEQDNMNTMIATGEYPDVMGIAYSSESAAQLYEDGIAIDLTEYVEKYMPNYQAWMEEHPEYADRMTSTFDGEKKFIQLYTVQDEPGDGWEGWEYRRDWLVKYGTNPQTGAAFTGGYDADGNWTDDVVFPSGNTDPIYISDWEWMMDVFAKALKGEGITDGYAMSMHYPGFHALGDFVSGFGEGPGWYIDDDGKCQFGGDSDAMRAYIECISTWYEKGWVDQTFDENASDLFFMADSAAVYSGKVGMWLGLNSQFDNALDTGDAITSGICVYGAPQPINDVYGDDSCKGHEPYVYYADPTLGGSIVVTNKAEEKDIATLLTAVDYLYSQEGGLLRHRGFSDEQQAKEKDEFYTKWKLDDGSYTVEKTEEGETIKVNNDVIEKEDGLGSAAVMVRLPGIAINKNVDGGLSEVQQHSQDMWKMYGSSGNIGAEISSQLTPDQTTEDSAIYNNMFTYMSQEVPKFVKGELDIASDSDWKAFCDALAKYDVDKYSDNINSVLGK